ncbi:peptidylprolyl isomerase [Chitinimonas koreensis]|uniref:peptidylprolyl isomerase n=1 Tax=Chitinimonas koreensis TaxID=356302 RepID=UPI00042134BD|nr:peptidyl-prolyl cis-trans isomerase [Chitinimonas koreensis]QNM96929.1 peptidyl-prolyl cis-trans isomerase [Chitinimonas koreensis]
MRRQSASRLRPALAALLAAGLALGGAALGASRDGLADPALAARIDGQPIPLAGLRVLHTVGAYRDMKVPLDKVLASVIDNRLLGDYAAGQYDEATLFPNTAVAFAREVAVEDQLVATLRRAYKAPLDAALARAGGLARLVVRNTVPSRQALEAVFPPGDALRLDAALTPQQLEAARAVTLLEYRFPGGETGRIDLAQLWQRQNIQGKTLLRGGDADYRAQQAMQLLGSRYVLAWARRDSGLSADDLALLRRAIEDRDRRGALLQLLGIEADMHYSSAHLKQLAAAATPAEVADYYARHPAEFRRIERVRARHIRCGDEAACRDAYERLRGGADFAAVARAASSAGDAADGGALGWLRRDDGQPSWLRDLAFALPPGKPSRPVREPGEPAAWQIVLVEEREEGLLPADSESVRYIAGQAIARKKAVAEFKALRERLYQAADIELNANALGFGHRALVAGAAP